MKPITIVFAVLALAGTVALWWQHESAGELKRGVESTNPVSVGNNFDPDKQTRDSTREEIRTLREQTKDLPKLRNEVGQLRASRVELAAARAENTRLLEAKKTGKPLPREAPPGFVLKEQLKNAGFATPEDAVQTFFWAMNQGDLGQVLQALSPRNADRKHIENSSPEQRAELEKNLGRDPMNDFYDFSVRNKEVISDTAVVLHVGSSLSTNTMKIQMEQNGGAWRLRNLPQ